jgi:Ca2+-binding RTX toxin-like protein
MISVDERERPHRAGPGAWRRGLALAAVLAGVGLALAPPAAAQVGATFEVFAVPNGTFILDGTFRTARIECVDPDGTGPQEPVVAVNGTPVRKVAGVQTFDPASPNPGQAAPLLRWDEWSGGRFTGTSGNDTLELVSDPSSPTTYPAFSIVVAAGDGNDTIDLNNVSSLPAAPDVQLVRTVDGGNGDNTLIGSAGDDRLVGGDGDDMIEGGDGNDTIGAHAGSDTIDGGDGEDTIDGGFLSDQQEPGTDSNDLLDGGPGDDTLSGGNGNDVVHGDAGNDQIEGEEGNDTISGGDGIDTLSGDEGNDSVAGGRGTDFAEGGTGSDTLRGGAGPDVLDGGAGSDTLWGGGGVDYLMGGGGPQDRLADARKADRCLRDGRSAPSFPEPFGDEDGDGDVDGFDFMLWKGTFGDRFERCK